LAFPRKFNPLAYCTRFLAKDKVRKQCGDCGNAGGLRISP
jgi:ribosomal protein S27AE